MQENWPLCEQMQRSVKTSNKKGSNFPVLNNDQESSDDEANITNSHEHLMAVQEDKKEEEYESDGDTAKE